MVKYSSIGLREHKTQPREVTDDTNHYRNTRALWNYGIIVPPSIPCHCKFA